MNLFAAAATATPEWLADDLDRLAQAILYYCNLTVAILAGLVVAIIYFVLWLRRSRKTPLLGPLVRLSLGMASVTSGLVSFAALTLSKQPRFDALSLNDWKLLGAASGVVLLGIGVFSYYSEFKEL